MDDSNTKTAGLEREKEEKIWLSHFGYVFKNYENKNKALFHVCAYEYAGARSPVFILGCGKNTSFCIESVIQWLTVLAAFPEDLNLIPSIQPRYAHNNM